MKVAVLMSTYNGEKYVEQQIDSILNQQGEFELKLLVRDDGSIDSTQEILEKYSKAGKLEWYSGSNRGVAKSFIELLKRCVDYDFYAFSDQDDYWSTNKIQSGIEQLSSFTEAPALYVSNAELVNSNLEPLGCNVYKNYPKLDFYTLSCAGGLLGCTMIFNNTLAKLVQKYPIPNKMFMHDFYLAILCSSVSGKIVYDNEARIKYRQHGNNVVGVAYGVFGMLKSRWNDITTKEKVSIAEQAYELCMLDEIDVEHKKWLKEISNYRNNMLNRIKLATTRKTKYINKNMAFKLRMSILLGNR